ncbi:PGF-pre-PGF domain-containing protein [Methanosarcina sp. Z-7115]|uniref:PGF-pre-PGF domain-containing protein n=1 Tax=Methanosarcina baikalica TaxID=3073890 RepID=A0ABU2CY61_9EURY|nr:PGF-pre-PGF domain-containing protein [Methanosarcina sp. Z-7115]MDR7664687.1 PGF-pre-PGF domain-containing protein [Methanosarcina sp. Z-7115]
MAQKRQLKTVGKITARVEILKEKSLIVSELPSDEVCRSLNIWVGNGGYATSENLSTSYCEENL